MDPCTLHLLTSVTPSLLTQAYAHPKPQKSSESAQGSLPRHREYSASLQNLGQHFCSLVPLNTQGSLCLLLWKPPNLPPRESLSTEKQSANPRASVPGCPIFWDAQKGPARETQSSHWSQLPQRCRRSGNDCGDVSDQRRVSGPSSCAGPEGPAPSFRGHAAKTFTARTGCIAQGSSDTKVSQIKVNSKCF